jgi:hypothetical protein
LEKIRPMTPFYKECRLICASPISMWWVHKLDTSADPLQITTTDAFNEYEDWIKVFHRRGEPVNFKKFSIDFKKYPEDCMKYGLVMDSTQTRHRGVKVNVKIFLDHLQSLHITDDPKKLPLL